MELQLQETRLDGRGRSSWFGCAVLRVRCSLAQIGFHAIFLIVLPALSSWHSGNPLVQVVVELYGETEVGAPMGARVPGVGQPIFPEDTPDAVSIPSFFPFGWTLAGAWKASQFQGGQNQALRSFSAADCSTETVSASSNLNPNPCTH